jgi:hypothetical protein
LSGRIEHVEESDLFVDETLFTVRILNGWVIPGEDKEVKRMF